MDAASSRHIIYWGPVKNFTAFIQVSSIIWFIATFIFANRFFHLRKHEQRQSSYHIFSFRPQTFVVCLCFLELVHTISAHISHFMTPGSLLFDSEDTATWAMKLVFLSTGITALVCQSYIIQIIYQLYNRKKIILYLAIPPVTVGFVLSVATILVGQAHLRLHTLEFYFSMVAVGAGISIVCDSVMGLIMALYPLRLLPGNTNINVCRIFRLLGLVLSIYPLMIYLPRTVYWLGVDGSIFWAYVDIAGYEVIGNSYPVLIIWLMGMKGFGTWEEAEDDTKVPLLPAA